MDEFVVESNGHCFFCLKQSSISFEPEPNSDNVGSSETYSIQYLSRYLKLDMRKMIHGNGPISADLLEKGSKSHLKVELCTECELWNERFSKLYKQLEMIEMELTSCAKPIVEKLQKSWKDNLFSFADLESINVGKLQVLKAFRVETMQKLSSKLSRTGPQVCVRELSSRELQSEMLKLKKNAILEPPPSPSNFSTTEQQTATEEPIDIVSDLKMESVSVHSIMVDDPNVIDDDNHYSDSEPLDSDSMSEDNEESVPVVTGYIPVKCDAADDEIGKELTGNFFEEAEVPPKKSAAFADKCRFNHKTGKRTCKSCSKQYSTYAAFWYHYKSVHMKIMYTCSLCRKMFSAAFSYKRHQKTFHKGAKFTCSKCNEHFELEYHLLKHSRTCGADPGPGPIVVLGQASESSGKAQKWKITTSVLEESLKSSGMSRCTINPKNGTHTCTLCKHNFSRKYHFQRHYYRVHLRGRFQCGLCNKTFPRKCSLQAHLRDIHRKDHTQNKINGKS